MVFKFKKIHHLIRYFVLIGISCFFAYLKVWNDEINFYLIGPPIYLAYFLKEFLSRLVTNLTTASEFYHYGLLLPMIMIYFLIIGTLLKILWNEYGAMRMPTFLSFCGFLIFIHYFSAQNILRYYQVYP